MFISKKVLIIGVLCVVILAATIGGVAIANADNSSTQTTQTQNAVSTLMQKVADIYQQNTGTAIDPAQLQEAFKEAGQAIQSDRIDQMLQKLVSSGKITQAQADQWKAWWDSRPTTMFSDQYKTWLQSRPDIPGLNGGTGTGKLAPFGHMRGFGSKSNSLSGQTD